jgi:hypothetical protein
MLNIRGFTTDDIKKSVSGAAGGAKKLWAEMHGMAKPSTGEKLTDCSSFQ